MDKNSFFKDTCRLCLSGEPDRLVCINRNETLISKISNALEIIIEKNDKLPQTVCDECITKVENWTSYKITVTKHQKYLNRKFETFLAAQNSEVVLDKTNEANEPKKRKSLTTIESLHAQQNGITNDEKRKQKREKCKKNKIVPNAYSTPAKQLKSPQNLHGDIRQYLSPKTKSNICNSDNLSTIDEEADVIVIEESDVEYTVITDDEEDICVRQNNNEHTPKKRQNVSKLRTSQLIVNNKDKRNNTSRPPLQLISDGKNNCNAKSNEKEEDSQNVFSVSRVKIEPFHRSQSDTNITRLRWHPGGTFCSFCNLFMAKRDIFVKHVRSRKHVINRNWKLMTSGTRCLTCKLHLASGEDVRIHKCENKTKHRRSRYNYPCDKCYLSFTNKRELCRHTKLLHNMVLDATTLKPTIVSLNPKRNVMFNTKQKCDATIERINDPSTSVAELTKSGNLVSNDNHENQSLINRGNAITFKNGNNKNSIVGNDNNNIRTNINGSLEQTISLNVRKEKRSSQEQKRCHICDGIFADTQSLNIHLATHSNKTLSCVRCSKEFNYKKTYLYHLNKCYNLVGEQVFCNLCFVVCKNREDRDRHKFTNHNKKVGHRLHSCNICPKFYHTIRELKDHKRNTHFRIKVQKPTSSANKVSRCLLCHLIFKTGKHEEHFSVCRGPFSCYKCDENFFRFQALLEHSNNTHGINSLVSHIKIIPEVETSDLNTTGKSVNKNTGSPLESSVPSNSFDNSFSSIKVYRCSKKCGYETTCNKKLQEHKYRCSGSSFRCSHCFNYFASGKSLKRHISRCQAATVKNTSRINSATLPSNETFPDLIYPVSMVRNNPQVHANSNSAAICILSNVSNKIR